MKKTYFASMVLALAVSSAAFASDDSMIEIGGVSNQVYVLKHAEKGAAFVRVGDMDRLSDLMENKGYELVVKEGPNGPEAVVGDVVSEEEAQSEAEVLGAAPSSDSEDPREIGEILDIGLGLNIGLTTGGKARLLATLESGFVVGVDLEVGTVLFLSDLTASAIFGWSFEAGKHVIRPYATIGGGGQAIFALLAIAEGPIAHAGVGVEWKPTKWFGLGIEGGVNALFGYEAHGPNNSTSTSDETLVTPYVRLTVMFYFL